MLGVFHTTEISKHYKSTAHLAVDLNPELSSDLQTFVAMTSQLDKIIFCGRADIFYWLIRVFLSAFFIVTIR